MLYQPHYLHSHCKSIVLQEPTCAHHSSILFVSTVVCLSSPWGDTLPQVLFRARAVQLVQEDVSRAGREGPALSCDLMGRPTV